MPSRKPLIALAVLAVAGTATPAVAVDMKCGCFVPAKEGLDGKSKELAGKTYKLDCVDGEDFKDHASSVSVQETKVKLYVDSDNLVQGDTDMKIRFRPRDGKCLDSVADGRRKSLLWAGAWCDNDDYKDVGLFRIEEEKETGSDGKVISNYVASFRATVTGPSDYAGAVIFNKIYEKKGDPKLYMVAACLENK